ncbi:AAA family ATPase [Nocardioides sp. GXZ039]|uniref:AAA family ATPase n=1 Tax=Nocardioides sp. GXZ039 TaxID=3136018 RepID=UPI0030F42420
MPDPLMPDPLMPDTPDGPQEVAPLPIGEASTLATAVLDEVERAVVGKRGALTLVLAAILAKGHVLIEDLPGLGKTLTARSFAQVLGLDFSRAQFTPDLLPADLTGSFLYDQRRAEFEFRPGPVFAGLLLADEINRTPPKTQAALLEAMQERQVTVEGQTFALPDPFCVLATANPVEYEGTYPLPEAQLDRFLLRVGFGYPSADHEYDVVARRIGRRREEIVLDRLADPARVRALQATVETVVVDESVGRYCVALAAETRSHPHVQIGSSPRGSLGLALAARGFALIRGRDYVVPEDVKVVARAALGHRISVKPELWMTDATGESVVDEVLRRVPTPSTVEQR